MRAVSYYRAGGEEDNVALADVPLRVNCCGVAALAQPFVTDSPRGRRDYYFLYMAEGGLRMRIGGRERELAPGDFVIFPPHTPYHYALAQGTMAYYWIHFTGNLVEPLLADCALSVNRLHHPGLDEEAAGLLRRLHRCFLTRGMGFDTACAGYLALLIARIGQCLHAAQNAPFPGERVGRALEYLHSHYAEPVTLGHLAELEYLSPSRFSAVFRACTGVSPMKYLIDLRIRGARELMLTTDLPLKQIALSVGYADQLYFSRLFRRVMGASPSEYRRKLTGG